MYIYIYTYKYIYIYIYVEYFNDFLTTYSFKQELLNFATGFIPDFENIYILGTLNNTFTQNCYEFHDSV